MVETVMWLSPLPIFAIVSLVMYVRGGLSWTWGICVQQLLILSASAAALYALFLPGFGFASPKSSFTVWGLVFLAWGLFLVFSVGQRLSLNALVLDLSLMKVREARARLPLLRFTAWGPPGAYWTAVVNAMGLYHDGKRDEADALIDKWRQDTRIPSNVRDSLSGYTMFGRVMQGDWHGVVEAHVDYLKQSTHVTGPIPLELVVRAYAEEHKWDEAFVCLRSLLERATRISPTSVDLNFIPLMALSGASDGLEAVLKQCKDTKSVPEYARLLWLGRCYTVCGQKDRALKFLNDAMTITPQENPVWQSRINRAIEKAEAIGSADERATHGVAPTDDGMQVVDGIVAGEEGASAALPDEKFKANLWQTYKKWRAAADMMRPAQITLGLKILAVALVVAFMITSPRDWIIVPLSSDLMNQLSSWQNACQEWGRLDKHLWSGEWWRIITYMFLHGNLPHLALNAGALFLFGRSVINMYGGPKFFVIYFGSGILSGLFQLALMPGEPAIGASGAILGIFGAVTAGLIKMKGLLPRHLRASELKWMFGIAAIQVVFDQGVNWVADKADTSRTGVRVAAFAHLGGMVAGFALGMLLPLRKWDDSGTVDSASPRS